MKKTYLMILLMLSITAGRAQVFIVKGKVTMPDSLNIMFGNGVNKIDTLIASNGYFELKGNLTHPDLYTIVFQDKHQLRNYLKKDIFIESGEITVDCDFRKRLLTVNLQNNNTNQAYLEYRKRFNPLVEVARSVIDSSFVAGKNADQKKIYTTVYNKICQVEDEVALQFVTENKHSIVGALVFYSNLQDLPVDKLDSVYHLFAPELQSTRFLQSVATHIKGIRASANGKLAPDFTQNNINGHPVSLSEYKGRYVLIDFWASWCGPCRRENPNLIAVYNQFKNKNFNIIGISLDEHKKDWLKAIEDDKLPWDQLSDLKGWANVAAALYAVKAVPQNFLIDPAGNIIAQNLHGGELKKQLEKLIK